MQGYKRNKNPTIHLITVYLWVLELSDKGMSKLTGLLLLRSLLS